LRGFASLAVAAGEPAHAARLLAAADELFAATGATRWPAERLGGPETGESLRASLCQEALAVASSAGKKRSLSQVIDEAIGEVADAGTGHDVTWSVFSAPSS
jgi:hypothetical protein